MGGVRNKQMLRVALIVGVILVILYLFFSWQSDVKAHKDKLTAASAEYQELLVKYNKLTEELKSNVRTAAETRHELETARKNQRMEATKREEQIRMFKDELRQIKSTSQRMESERDRLKSENAQLEEAKQSVSDELARTVSMLDELKLSCERDTDDLRQCRADLEGMRSKLLAAQTETVGTGEKLQECQLQLSTATDAFESCQQRINVLETDNHNKLAEIQQLQTQANLYKQQQQESQKHPVPQGKFDTGFKDHVISDEQRQKTLAMLKEKRKNGETLDDQEQHILKVNEAQAPQKQKISVPVINPEAKPEVPVINNQQPPPPDNRPGHQTDEEQVEDLIDEGKKQVNLDNQEDNDFEGGADGGDQHDGRDLQQEEEYQRNEYGDKEGEEDKENGNPLPNPVEGDQGNLEEDYEDDPEGHQAFQKDKETAQNEMRRKVIEQDMRGLNREIR